MTTLLDQSVNRQSHRYPAMADRAPRTPKYSTSCLRRGSQRCTRCLEMRRLPYQPAQFPHRTCCQLTGSLRDHLTHQLEKATRMPVKRPCIYPSLTGAWRCYPRLWARVVACSSTMRPAGRTTTPVGPPEGIRGFIRTNFSGSASLSAELSQNIGRCRHWLAGHRPRIA